MKKLCSFCENDEHGSCVNYISFPRCQCEKHAYVFWHSRRNGNDGRRESAISWNAGVWHIVGKTIYKTHCGRNVGPMETYSLEINGHYNKKICKICKK